MSATTTSKLEWCTVRLGQDMNWWVEEISDPVHWDLDALSILDPRQTGHIIELAEPLQEYGFDPASIDSAFYRFRIEKEEKEGRVRLKRVRLTLLEAEEPLFGLPDVIDEEKGPYADFLNSITRARVKMLNDSIEFSKALTVDELEEEIRERNSADYMEGRATHVFSEVTTILEYVPEGFELEEDDEGTEKSSDDESLEAVDIPDFEEDEKIEEDETMRWDDEEDEEKEEEYEEVDGPPDEDKDRN